MRGIASPTTSAPRPPEAPGQLAPQLAFAAVMFVDEDKPAKKDSARRLWSGGWRRRVADSQAAVDPSPARIGCGDRRRRPRLRAVQRICLPANAPAVGRTYCRWQRPLLCAGLPRAPACRRSAAAIQEMVVLDRSRQRRRGGHPGVSIRSYRRRRLGQAVPPAAGSGSDARRRFAMRREPMSAPLRCLARNMGRQHPPSGRAGP